VITLSSGHQKVSIDSGELVGYEVDGHEFIHQKGSPGWGSSDTEMFPIIGPVNEAAFQVQVPKGSAIQDQHGLLRQFPYETISQTQSEAIFKKTYKAGTLIKNSKYPQKSPKEWLVWPYSFVFEKRFHLSVNGLVVHFTISGERDMPYMLGYHPAFKLHTEKPTIVTRHGSISLQEVMAVGSRALQVPDCNEIILKDKRDMAISTKGFGHFMCWTEVPNMVCIEPISFYPYAVRQTQLHEGFTHLGDTATLTVTMTPQ